MAPAVIKLVALAKGAAALFTGSAALWAETLHSFADTGDELLLFVGLHRSKKKEDPGQPFGYGQERYFWALLASLGIFLIGGLRSVVEGIRSLLRPIREAVNRPDWVAHVSALDAIFVGPAELLVIARVVPVPRVAGEPAGQLVARVEQLRHDLLRAPANTEVAVSVEGTRR